MSKHVPTVVMVAVSALIIGVMIIACTSAPPAEPSIRGFTSSVTRTGADSAERVSMLVTGTSADGLEYDLAVVTADDSTQVVLGDDGRGSLDDLVDGLLVEVWFEGPVAESYPVQATAGEIRVLSRGPE